MDSIVRTRTVGFTPDRMPMMRRIKLGLEGDNLVERLRFMLPVIAEHQTATLMKSGFADGITLDWDEENGYYVDLTREIIGSDGEAEAYIRIDGAGGEVWQSDVMRLTTGALPDVETEIEQQYPTAVGQMLAAMEAHRAEMDEQLPKGVEAALAQAKESGEFDGPKGDPGEDGVGIADITVEEVLNPNNRDMWKVTFKTTDGKETTYTVADGKDGRTPVKGIDYTDGAPGADGPGITNLTVTKQTDADGGNFHRIMIQWDESRDEGVEHNARFFDVYDGADGNPGVHVGADEPTDPEVNVWVNPDGEPDPLLRYDEQELTEEQQARARSNIGAAGADEVDGLINDLRNKAEVAATVADSSTADVWEQGSISTGSGKNGNSSLRLRTAGYLSSAVTKIHSDYPYSFAIYAWDESDGYIGVWNGSAFVTTGQTWFDSFDMTSLESYAYKYRLVFRRSNDAAITPESYTYIHFTNAVFDAIEAVRAESDTKTDELFDAVMGDVNTAALWEKGGINITNGEYGATNVVRTSSYIPNTVKLVYSSGNWIFMTFLYDDTDTLVGVWRRTEISQTASEGLYYLMPEHLSGYKIRLIARRQDEADITTDDVVGGIHFLNDIRARMFYPTPTLTFIDDDGSLNALENWESITDEIGVKITSALVTGVMDDGETNPQKASWDDVARLQNKGYEFVSHTHNHINITEQTDEVVTQQFKDSIAALREHGCESRYIVYPYNAINTEKLPLVKKYFTAAIGIGQETDNILPIQTHDLKRYSINSDEFVDVEYEGETVSAHAFKTLDQLKGYIDTALINGGWVIIMTHLRNDGIFYHDEASRSMIIDLCKYAVEKGMLIQTFGEAYQRYKNVMETGTVNDSSYYITDCNGVVRYR